MSSTNNGFSFDTIQSFDTHIEQSIPGYTTLQKAIVRLATHFIKENSCVYDLGCSTGLLLSRLAELAPMTTELVGVDRSINLLGKAASDRVTLLQADLTAESFRLKPANLVISIFTLQFLPLDARQVLIDKIYEALPVGGALIISEKIYVDDGYLQEVFMMSHYDLKFEHFSKEDVLAKQIALRRIMRPLSENENMALLSRFSRIISFWQLLNFKAYLCIK